MLSSRPTAYNSNNSYKNPKNFSGNIQTDVDPIFSFTYTGNITWDAILKISQGKSFITFVKTSLIYYDKVNKQATPQMKFLGNSSALIPVCLRMKGHVLYPSAINLKMP